MWKKLIAAAVLVGVFAVPASAAIDLGEGQCQQTDGQLGVWNGTSADDAGCITEAEYVESKSAAAFLEAGLIDGYTVNSDGTTTLDLGYGTITVVTNPLDRSTAVGPEPEPDAPTVREVLFPATLFPATAHRLAALIG